MATDARYRTKVYIDTYVRDASITSDAGTTELLWACMYEKPDYPLILEFRHPSDPVDGLYLVGEPDSVGMMDVVTQSPYGYEERVPITIATIDKSGITGTKLKDKMLRELRWVCEEYPEGSLRSLSFSRPKDLHLGSTVIHQTEYMLSYQRLTTV